MSSSRSGPNETTPLLRSRGQQFPASGPFPYFQGIGQLPHLGPGQNTNTQYIGPYQQYYNNHQSGTSESRRIVHSGDLGKDPHSQFCALTGCPPTNAPGGFKYKLNEKTLYGRAVQAAAQQTTIYQLTATLTNFLLLLQIVLGAALTGLGGAGVPSYVITIFGAANTIIAGLVAYLKSRGQPMRAKMFRDDLERVVDEIENSEVMWLGISKGVHGYDDIDTDAEVTVRSEVARLTRLLDKAIVTNNNNNPDLYSSAASNPEAGNGGGGRGPFMSLATLGNLPLESQNPAPVPSNNNADAAPATSAKGKKEKEEEERKKKEEEDKKKAADSAKPAEAPKTADGSKPAETPKPAEAPKETESSSKDQQSKQQTSTSSSTSFSNIVSSGFNNIKGKLPDTSTTTSKPPGSLTAPQPTQEQSKKTEQSSGSGSGYGLSDA